MPEFIIKPMSAEHIEEVLQIEETCNLGHWTRNDYEKELENQDSLFFVAEQNVKIIGFVLARLIMPSIEILNIGVIKNERKQGIGNALLKIVLQAAKKQKLTECWLEFRVSNLAAQQFYRSNNFEIVGKRKNYYSNPVEDAILMTLFFSEKYPKK